MSVTATRMPSAVSRAAPVPVVSLDRVAPAGWDARSVDAPGGHVMQGTAWAAHRASQGADPRFATFEDGRTALVILRRQRLVPGAVASVRRGPVHAGDPVERLVGRIAGLVDRLRDEGARELVVDPELEVDPAYEAGMAAVDFDVTREAQPSIHVMRLDLPPRATDATVWSGIARSTRQRIRSAEASGVQVRHDTSGERLTEFGELLVERADALGIAMRPERGYLAAWRRLLTADQARLLLAEYDGELVGGLLLYRQAGIVSTAYSADRMSRRRDLPGAMHLVRWTVIREAIAEGLPAVELGGVDVPGHRTPPEPGEPTHGLFVHKASFGARWVERTPAHRAVLRPWADRVGRLRGTTLGAVRSAAALVPGRGVRP